MLTLLLVACALDPADSVSGVQDPDEALAGVVVEDAWLACATDLACTSVPLDCAGCNSGGTSLALNVAFQDRFEDQNPDTCDPGMGFIALYVCDGEPVCRLGQCVWSDFTP